MTKREAHLKLVNEYKLSAHQSRIALNYACRVKWPVVYGYGQRLFIEWLSRDNYNISLFPEDVYLFPEDV